MFLKIVFIGKIWTNLEMYERFKRSWGLYLLVRFEQKIILLTDSQVLEDCIYW